MDISDHPTRKRAWYAVAVMATIVFGLASRQVPAVGKYPGDALWALMVFFGAAILLPRLSSSRLAVVSFGFSCAIEFLKLNQHPVLVSVRHSTLGHLVFGQVFSWQNLVAYAVGISAGVVLERLAGPWLLNRPQFSLANSGDSEHSRP
jgi:hypothetical protein